MKTDMPTWKVAKATSKNQLQRGNIRFLSALYTFNDGIENEMKEHN